MTDISDGERADPPEFEGDLAGAVFWGADLRGARFRDVDLTGTRISHAFVVDVEIDATVDRLVVNGVDVTDYVNQRDAWYPLRGMLQPADPAGMRAGWEAMEAAWSDTIRIARGLDDDQLHESVGGEWSFVETVRHLVLAMDKWFTVPILGGSHHSIGLPNTGSRDFGRPGIELDAIPSTDEALAVRAGRSTAFRDYLAAVTDDDLDRTVDVAENGPHRVRECLWTVLEEEFWHNRYARRDLAVLAPRSG